MSVGDPLQFNFTGWSGKDIFRALLPEKWQVKNVAKRYMAQYKPDPEKTICILRMPFGTFRILDYKGNVEPYTGPVAGIGL